jgi:PknH-like protein
MSTNEPGNEPEDPTIDWRTHRPADQPPPPAHDDGEATVQLGHTLAPQSQGSHSNPPPAAPTDPTVQSPFSAPPLPPPVFQSWSTPAPPPPPPAPPTHTAPPLPPVVRAGWPQAGPDGWYPSPPPGGAQPPPSHRRWWILGGAAALTAIIIAVVVIAVGGRGQTPTAPTTPTAAPTTPATLPPKRTTTPSPSSTSAPPPPTQASIDPATLPSLLLSSNEISQRLSSSPGMEAGPVINKTSQDSSVMPANCSGVWAVAEDSTYSSSGYTAIAGQVVNEKPKAYHATIQAVVSFPDAAAAKAFYDKQVADWTACKFQHIVARYPDGATDEGTVGVAANTDGTMNVLITITDVPSAPTMACERAMTVRANVIVDVRACSPNVGSAGWTIARDIGEKITGTR